MLDKDKALWLPKTRMHMSTNLLVRSHFDHDRKFIICGTLFLTQLICSNPNLKNIDNLFTL